MMFSKESYTDSAQAPLISDTDLEDNHRTRTHIHDHKHVRPSPFTSPLRLRLNALRQRSRLARCVCLALATTITCIASVLVWSLVLGLFSPAYTAEPPSHQLLRHHISSSDWPGRGNLNNEKVFVAANIINADLVTGAWGRAVQELVDILGPKNVFVSVYENDAGPEIENALKLLDRNLPCNTSIVTGSHIALDSLQRTLVSPTTTAVKRITYLAEVRNRALLPLDPLAISNDHDFRPVTTTFDKVLFLNDVYFSPLEAAQLLFATHADSAGVARYDAACAADFVSGTNYYDNYATRDSSGSRLGFGPGFRVFPWFAPGDSRDAVVAGSDAVPVRSCWGGMAAFKASYFQSQAVNVGTSAIPPTAREYVAPAVTAVTLAPPTSNPDALPVRFRAVPDSMYDASECCLIHADIAAHHHRADPSTGPAIYLNPYIRTAYTPATYAWLTTLRRFESAFRPIQWLLTAVVGTSASPRNAETPGRPVHRAEWVWNDAPTDSDALLRPVPRTAADAGEMGHYENVARTAGAGGFCGSAMMEYMRDDYVEANRRGEKSFVHVGAPSLRP